MLPVEWKRGFHKEVIPALEFITRAMVQGKTLKAAVAGFVEGGDHPQVFELSVLQQQRRRTVESDLGAGWGEA